MNKDETGQRKHPFSRGIMPRLCACVLLGAHGLAGAQSLTEDDYLGQELPVVLTATRLQQSLHDVPGAMTVIDRDMIRRSGARDVAELLRLVPGYMVGGINAAHLVAAYHAPLDEYGIRNLVFIDGRSVYSSYFLGDTQNGMMTVQLEDVERIEVLRGANSAAFGANAMFGVINIITRHAADSLGTELQVNLGSADLRDARVSLGWGDAGAAQRLSLMQRQDSGYANAFDDRRLRLLDWRADLRPANDQNLMLRAGSSDLQAGRADDPGDPERTVQRSEWYLQGRWQRQLAVDSQLQFSADFTSERYADLRTVPYKYLLNGLLVQDTGVIDYSGNAQRSNLELQHQLKLGTGLRAVWGLGWKTEQAQSWFLYSRREPIGSHESRAFGHLEWQPGEDWTSNAGVFVGNHSRVGGYVAPRLMFNHHFTPDHTLRFGVNRSLRTNSLIELAGDVRYYNLQGLQLQRNWIGSADIRPEVLQSQEISYLGQIRPLRLTVDVRAYRERVTDLVGTSANLDYKRINANPNLPMRPDPNTPVALMGNLSALTVRGIEYQLSWSLREGSRLQWQQNFGKLEWSDIRSANDRQPPMRASSLAWFQALPGERDLALLWHERSEMSWQRLTQRIPAYRRLDLRLAQRWRMGSSKAETALTLQALNGDQTDSRPEYAFKRRAFLTLKLEN